MSKFTEGIVTTCLAELATFEQGKLLEDDAKVYKRVGEYWQAIPVLGIDGRTKQKGKNGKFFNPAWSAAFISFVARASGAGKKFHYAEAHCHYVEYFRKAASENLGGKAYCALDPYSVAPRVGDIVCAGREYAANLTFQQAELAYKADRFYPSHSDFVVEVNTTKGYLRTIGGNVGSSVREKQIQISNSGKLIDRIEGSKVLPWLALLRCQIA